MKFMLIMRATDEAYASFAEVDMTEMLEVMGRFDEELVQAGVLLAAEGLDDASTGVVVDYSATPPVVTDGPYGETEELLAGSTSWRSPRWRRPSSGPSGCRPAAPGFKTEIRRVPSIDELPQDNPWVIKERA